MAIFIQVSPFHNVVSIARGETKRVRAWKEVYGRQKIIYRRTMSSGSHFRHRSRQDEVTNKGTTKEDEKRKTWIESNSYSPLVIRRSGERKRERERVKERDSERKSRDREGQKIGGRGMTRGPKRETEKKGGEPIWRHFNRLSNGHVITRL